jgi:PRTRC genetic system protein B
LPAGERVMFFSDRGDDPVLKKMNGKRYPHPPLLFKVRGNQLWVRALEQDKRPDRETQMFVAPYWNCYDNGEVCTGSMKIPRETSVAAIHIWEESFFQSEFTHSSGTGKQTRFSGGFLGMWQSLERKKEFPREYLVESSETLSQFVNHHDHSKRNEVQPRQ